MKDHKQTECPICNYIFSTTSNLSEHLKRFEDTDENITNHSKRKQINDRRKNECPECKITFIKKGNLTEHLKLH